MATGSSTGEGGTQPAQVVEIKPDGGEFGAQLKREVQTARQQGRQPYALAYALFCRASRALAGSISHSLMEDVFRGTHIIKIDVYGWGETVLTVFPELKAVPMIYRLDENARPAGQIGGDAWGENTPEKMYPPLRDFFAQHRPPPRAAAAASAAASAGGESQVRCQCPACGRWIRGSTRHVGRAVNCPACSSQMVFSDMSRS